MVVNSLKWVIGYLARLGFRLFVLFLLLLAGAWAIYAISKPAPTAPAYGTQR